MFFPPVQYPPIILCGTTYVRVRLPSGEPAEVPEDSLGRGPGVSETWTEVSRQTSTVDVDGVQVERIDQIVMRKSGGGTVTLVFANPN